MVHRLTKTRTKTNQEGEQETRNKEQKAGGEALLDQDQLLLHDAGWATPED